MARKEAEKAAAERAATEAAAERLHGSAAAAALRRAPSAPGADSGSDGAPLYMHLRPTSGNHGAVPSVSSHTPTCGRWQ